MLRKLAPTVIAMLLAALPAAAAEDDAEHHVAQKGDIKVVHAWSRATEAGEGAVFLEIENRGAKDDRLTGAETDVADRVEIHGATMQDGEMVSQPLELVDVPADGEFALEPGSVFLKLVGLKEPLRQGEGLEVGLEFAEAGELDVHVLVEAADATQHSDAGTVH
jgi:periplasmic copper chaperone A